MKNILAAAALSLVTALSGFTPAAQAQSMANTVPSGEVRHWQHRDGGWGNGGWRDHGPRYNRGGYYRDRYYGDRYYRRGPSAGAIIGGLAAGAIIGGALAAPRYYNSPRSAPRYVSGDPHVRWCYGRYRSYRASDNTFQPNYGPRRECVSPY